MVIITVLGILKILTIISEGSYMISVASKKETAMKGLFKTSAGKRRQMTFVCDFANWVG